MTVGLDVATAHPDVAVRPSGETWQLPADSERITALLEWRRPFAPALIVLEASGGWETPVASTPAEAGLPMAVVNPRQVRDFARATACPPARTSCC